MGDAISLDAQSSLELIEDSVEDARSQLTAENGVDEKEVFGWTDDEFEE